MAEDNAVNQQVAMGFLDRAGKLVQMEHLFNTGLFYEYEFVVLNNGIEFAATYFIMLLALFFIGAGRYLGLAYWIARRFRGR